MSSEAMKELAITAELCGASLSDAAAQVIVMELRRFKEADVVAGLREMRLRHEGRFTLAAVVKFIEAAQKERIANIQRCMWCPQEATATGYCEEHSRQKHHIDEAKDRRFRALQAAGSIGKAAS